MLRATSVEPVNDDAANARVAHQHGPDCAIPGNEMQSARRNPAGMQQTYDFRSDQWRLLRRLRDDHISGYERSHDLPGENRQRKIPRADADKNAASAITQFVALARRTRHRFRNQGMPRLHGVVTAEIRRFTHLRHAVVKRLATFSLQ